MNASIKKLVRFLSDETRIPADEIHIDESMLKQKTLKKNDFFLSAGRVCDQIAYLESGLIRSYYLQDGNEINTCFYKENSLVCSFMSLISQTPSEIFLQALEESEVLLISFENLNRLYASDQRWQAIGRILTEKECAFLTNRVSFLNFESAKIKYQNLLKEDPGLINRVSVQHLASYIGVSRETLSRIRSAI